MSCNTQVLDKADGSFYATILKGLTSKDYNSHIETLDGDVIMFGKGHARVQRGEIAFAKQTLEQQKKKEKTRCRLEKKLLAKKILALQ